MSTLAITLPRVAAYPDGVSSAGQEAIDLARMAGLDLDGWQQLLLDRALTERADGKWAAFEVAQVVPRQNGKGGVLEARELAALYLFSWERLIIHSAHQFDTSIEHFRRLLTLIESTPELDRRVRRVSRSHGEEGIELDNGKRIRFRTRTKGGGRGFTGDVVILDEAMILPEAMVGALIPTMSARPNPQLWYAGSAVDQLHHDHGLVLSRVRERGIRGDDQRLVYFEWSVGPPEGDTDPWTPDRVPDEVVFDRKAWAEANPALGIRISEEHVAAESQAMPRREFIVERLGVGDWPRTSGKTSIIDLAAWRALADQKSAMADPIVLAFDVSPSRSVGTIAAAGQRPGGGVHVEIVDQVAGPARLADRIAGLINRHDVTAVWCDGRSPAASLVDEMRQDGITVETTSTQDYVTACGLLVDAVAAGRVHHLGTREMEDAIAGAATRSVGDAWAWARRTSSVDITPLVAVTLAHWVAQAPAQEFFIY